LFAGRNPARTGVHPIQNGCPGAISRPLSVESNYRGQTAVLIDIPPFIPRTRADGAGTRRAAVAKLVYDFTEGNKDLKDLLGGKGANLAEMTNLGLPVPPGFIITTEACREYLREGAVPDGLAGEVSEHLRQLEKKMGRQLGDPADPLLVSVRSGAKFSMPGMMETVLNIGLSDESVHGLAKQSGSERFAWDSYRRLS